MNLVKPYQHYIIFGASSALVVTLYLLVTSLKTSSGFPLDDAWIHQVFARNLGLHGQFAYNPGQIVSGSTSPLWSILLAPAYWLGNDFYKVWAYLLGIVFLGLSALEVYSLSLLIFKRPDRNPYYVEAWCAAGFTLLEWHLVWAAASGMETVLFTFLTLWLIRLALRAERQELDDPNFKILYAYLSLGLVGGLLTLVRPEGLVLLGLIGAESARIWYFSPSYKRNLANFGSKILLMLIGWLLLVVPYLIFNYASSGSPLPTTFYAKASFYTSNLTLASVIQFFTDAIGEIVLHSASLFLGVASICLALVLVLQPKFRKTIGEVDWRLLAWPVVVLLLYSFRLPVTYQHARYLIPLYPFIILYGVWSLSRLLVILRLVHLPVLSRAIPPIIAIVVVVACLSGALTYQSDVQVINDEQVQIGLWLRDNTKPDALIATHDVGAITYFSQRRVIDTVGLINPEFIPILHDENATLQKVQSLGVDYFALMANWYPQLYLQLSSEKRQIFQPSQQYLTSLGSGNIMSVFKLK